MSAELRQLSIFTTAERPVGGATQAPPAPRPAPVNAVGTALAGMLRDCQRYQSSKGYADLLGFLGRMRTYAPFNAALIHIQRPDSGVVASAADWRRRFNRTLKPTARPIIILRPFGPVDLVFDATDTDGDPLPPEVLNPFPATGEVEPAVWNTLVENARKQDIEVVLAPAARTDAGSAATVCVAGAASPGAVRYRVTINETQTLPQRIATLAHELGHVCCGHLGQGASDWWPDRRDATAPARLEVEAESVANVVCDRLGITCNQAPYLARFMSGGTLPEIALDQVCAAIGAIMEMAGQGPTTTRAKRPAAARGG